MKGRSCAGGLAGCTAVLASCSLLLATAPAAAWAGGTDVRAAVVQYAVQEPDAVGVDAERVAEAIRKAAAAGAKLVVLPELTFYRTHPWERNGVTILDLAQAYGDLVKTFSQLARELGVAVVLGVWEPSGDPTHPVFNTALFLGPDGTLLGKHRKVVPNAAEYDFTKPGSEAQGDATPFATPFGRVGMLIGQDMATRFWPNGLAAKKLDLFVALLAQREGGWRTAVATCLAGRCPGLAANRSDAPHVGNSGAVNRDGTALAQAGGGEETLLVTIPARGVSR
jgi:nitrilase